MLLQDAEGLFATQEPTRWKSRNRLITCWDQEGFSTLEGFDEPVRVMKTVETIEVRRRVARKWVDEQQRQTWSWATTLSKNLCPSPVLHRAGHLRWEVENDIFHTLSTHWGLDHCFHHAPLALVNFVLTLLRPAARVPASHYWERFIIAI